MAQTGYDKGICGAKIMTLDAGTPDFLSVTPDPLDPINNPLTIELDKDGLAFTDCIEYTISYTVVFAEADYASLAPLNG